MKKLLIFHPALAPYRLDFFNSISEDFDAIFYFSNENLVSQKFNQNELKKKTRFKSIFLKNGFVIKNRIFRFGIWNAINMNKPEVILVNEYNPITIMVYLYSIFVNKKTKIYTICDDNKDIINNCNGIRKVLRNYLIKRIDGAIFTNNETKDWYTNNLKTNAKLLVFPIVRDENIYKKELSFAINLASQLVEKYSLKKKKVILFVGRLVADKNITLILKIAKILKEERSDFMFVIVGSGIEEDSLKNQSRKLKVDNEVIFTGRKEGNELLAWYNIAHYFILPSIFEPFGAVVNEALIAGNFVFCSNKAGASTLIKENINGVIVSPYAIENWCTLINIKLDECFLETKITLKGSLMQHTYKDLYTRFVNEFKMNNN